MRVLVACEFSGVVRNAFRALGHDAFSCDLLESEGARGFDYHHFQCDILDLLKGQDRYTKTWGPKGPWDLLIAHPPCTYLCNSGVRWLYKGGRKANGEDSDRHFEALKAAGFFNAIFEADIPQIAIENPVMHGYARNKVGPPAQIIQPWQFGHGEIKATGLWLKNLPKLVPTKIVEGRTPRVHHASPGPDRWKERSRTMTGIAAAMAAQWGNL